MYGQTHWIQQRKARDATAARRACVAYNTNYRSLGRPKNGPGYCKYGRCLIFSGEYIQSGHVYAANRQAKSLQAAQ